MEHRDDSDYWRKRIEGKEVVTFHRGYSNDTMTFTINRVKRVRGTIEIHLGKRITVRCLKRERENNQSKDNHETKRLVT